MLQPRTCFDKDSSGNLVVGTAHAFAIWTAFKDGGRNDVGACAAARLAHVVLSAGSTGLRFIYSQIHYQKTSKVSVNSHVNYN